MNVHKMDISINFRQQTMRDAAFLYAEEKRENNRECTENTEK